MRMLKCHSQIVSPFTKKIVSYGYDSVLRTPFGTVLKKGVVLHLGNHKHLIKSMRDSKHEFIKEQKGFLWTSIYFLRNSKDKKWECKDADLKKSAKDSQISDKSDGNQHNCQGMENHDLNNNLVKFSHLKHSDDTSNKNSKIINFFKDKMNNVNENSFVTSTVISKEADFKNVKSDSTNGIDKHAFSSSNMRDQEKLKTADSKTQLKGDGEMSTCPLTYSKKHIQGTTSSGAQGLSDRDKVVESYKLNSEELKNLSQKSLFLGTSSELPNRKTHEMNLGAIDSKIQLDVCNEAFCPEEKPQNVTKLPKETPSSALLEKAKGILKKTVVLKQEDESRNIKIINLGQPKGDSNLNITTRRRQTVDLNRCSTERNFITPVRAMTDFLLKPSDLEGLRKTKRRSPYENDPPITVYWRKDVEAKALDVWGSKENLLKEILKRDIERRRYQQNLFTVKRRLRDYRREQGREKEIKSEQSGLFGSSGKVVLTAIAINGTNFLFKLLACVYTGSHSMFSEAVHSLADTINQLILAYGIHKSVQRADSDHPYGYTNMRYVASLISGVGIFCVGSGLSFYHGFVGLTDPSDLPSFYWAYFILGGSLFSEGATLLVACNSIRVGARKSDMTFSEYVWRGQDPSVNVVLLEDLASVIGVACAGSCMGLSSYYDSHIPDAIGSFLVGGLLAGVASFIIYTNVAALVGRSIPQERLDKINAELESDVMIRAIHDVKGIDIGNSLVRYKAEMDFDGGELTRSYLDKQDLNQMLEEVKKMQTIDDLEEFMLKHGENIVDMMGGEIDRIELKLRKKHPEIRHCDLEIL